MRTSLTELRTAVAFLTGKLHPADALVYETRLLTSHMLRNNQRWLEKLFLLLKIYHRRQLKQEAENVHRRIWTNPEKAAFRSQVQQLFPEAGKPDF